MRLIELHTQAGETLYVNPEFVVSIRDQGPSFATHYGTSSVAPTWVVLSTGEQVTGWGVMESAVEVYNLCTGTAPAPSSDPDPDPDV